MDVFSSMSNQMIYGDVNADIRRLVIVATIVVVSLLVFALLVLYVARAFVKTLVKDAWGTIKTTIISYTVSRLANRVEDLETGRLALITSSVFNKALVEPKGTGHTHPRSAYIRKVFYKIVRRTLAVVPAGVVGIYQAAKRDFNANVLGTKHKVVQFLRYHWFSDVTRAASSYSEPINMEVIVDTDYYMNMGTYLARPRTVFLYTLQPSATAKVTDEYEYYFNKDNTLTYRIIGTGDVFTHEVWNWSSGSWFYASNWLCGTMYRVLNQYLADDRHMVVLVPSVVFGFFGSWLIRLLGWSDTMVSKYETYRERNGIALHCLETGSYVHAGVVDGNGRCVKDFVLDKSAVGNALATHTSSPACTPAAHTQLVAGDPSAANILWAYAQIEKVTRKASLYSQTSVGMTSAVRFSNTDHWPWISGIGEPVNGQTLPVTQPMPAFIGPVGETGVTEAYIKRIVAGREQTAGFDTEAYTGYAREFAKLMLKDAQAYGLTLPVKRREVPEESEASSSSSELKTNTPNSECAEGAPGPSDAPLASEAQTIRMVSPQEVCDQLNMPKHVLARARVPPMFAYNTEAASKVFAKAEVYGEGKAARLIVDVNHEYKHAYSMVTIALAHVLKTTNWYAFGMNPRQLGDACVRLASGRSALLHGLMETDYSRFDSTCGVFRACEREILREMFKDEADVAIQLWEKQLEARVKAKDFKRTYFEYNCEGERLSGSPETSVFNSIDNALVAYIALRSKYGPEEAYAHLGLYGGDDGIMTAEVSEQFEKVTKQIGLVCKATFRKVGRPWSFLGRYYMGWDGLPWSCYDPVRFVIKTQYSADKVTPAIEILGRKIGAYLITDPKTPWVVDLAEKYRAVYGYLPELKPDDISIENNYYAWLVRGTEVPFPIPDKAPSWFAELYDQLLREEVKSVAGRLSAVKILDGVLQAMPEVLNRTVPKPKKHGIRRPMNIVRSSERTQSTARSIEQRKDSNRGARTDKAKTRPKVDPKEKGPAVARK